MSQWDTALKTARFKILVGVFDLNCPIQAITFTNKSAREIRERIARTLGQEPEGLTISTFHALGVKFLQAEHVAAGLKRNFSVLADDESRAVIKDLAI